MKVGKKRFLTILLSVCILCNIFSFFSVSFAEGSHWASETVNTLNDIYGEDVFVANDDKMLMSDVKTILDAIGWQSSVTLGGDFTRAKACDVLADVFSLPVGEGETASIEYLFNQGIINGYAPDNDLCPDGEVTFAQFAVLTYRVLRFVGVGNGTNTGLKPGTEEYFAYSYLRVRSVNVDTEGNIDDEIWNGWNTTLGVEIEYPAEYEGEEVSQLEAAINFVDKCIEEKEEEHSIFSDVHIGDWCYDGVMYLFDNNIVNGNVGGTFNPSGDIDRMTFTMLLSKFTKNYENINISDVSVNMPDDTADWLIEANIEECMKKAIAKGCMTEPENDPQNWWKEKLTRGEAITAIMKAVDTNVDNVNLDVLQRFTDSDELTDDVSPYIVYSVMIGLVRGNGDGSLGLDATTNRGQIAILLYRTLIGADNTKVQDYQEYVNGILNANEE